MSINLKGISKSYKNNFEKSYSVLKNIELDIADNEMIAIMGKSGAGKSTLLNIIGCLDTADSGEYYLDGENINKLSNMKVSEYRNNKFGFIMQDFALIEDESVRHNIKIPTYFSKKKSNTSCEKLTKKLEIHHLLDKKAGLISGGEKQRVAIARALINEPKYILADEPTGALDSKTGNEIMELFLKLHKEGKTIIIVTHDKEIANRCEKIIEISDGRII